VAPIRWVLRKSPLGGGMLDFSFIVAFLLIHLLTPPLANFVDKLGF
jgi:uncharacterized protein YggT (Ycf19 family)